MTPNLDFGFYPERLDFKIGNVVVRTLDDFDQSMKSVVESNLVERGWYYAPRAACSDLTSGNVRTLPYSDRIFGLPKTHSIEHSKAVENKHLRFLVSVFGFILGMRMSENEAGFLDATPVKPGMLHDIVWLGNSDQKALAVADQFWQRHLDNPRLYKVITGIIHSLFLGQSPNSLCFERFIYLYTALDSCHYVQCLIDDRDPRSGTHKTRIADLCGQCHCHVPKWAENPELYNNKKHDSLLSACRNETLHEGLLFDEPLGFRTFGGQAKVEDQVATANIVLEMQALICRLLCAIIGFDDQDYIGSPVDTRQRIGLRL